MAAAFSQSFFLDPGRSLAWQFGFVLQVNRLGLQVQDELAGGYRYRGFISTINGVSGGGDVISGMFSLTPVWHPETLFVTPRTFVMANLVFHYSRRNPSAITFRFFVDDAIV